jgi:NTE family protein
MNKGKNPKIGLALGSGAAKGLAHIGVLKVLQKHNVPIDFIAGSSIGAMLGAFYAAHLDINELENIILNFNRKKSLSLIDFTMQGGFLKGKKAELFIAEILNGAHFGSLKIPFAVVATDINSAETVIFKHGNLVKAIRASISVPAFFQPIQYSNHLLADGGLSNPVPVDIVKKMGADITIAVNLDSVYIEKPFKNAPSLSLIPMHSVSILRHTLAKQSIKTADVVIEPPDVYHVGLLGWKYIFDNTKAKEIIAIGEKAAEEAMPEVRHAMHQYTYRQTRIGKFFSFFSNMRNKDKRVSFRK